MSEYGILEYMAIAEFKRNILMDRYKILGDTYKEEVLKKLDELEELVTAGVEAFIEPIVKSPESNDQKE